jgi:hypothetical protein
MRSLLKFCGKVDLGTRRESDFETVLKRFSPGGFASERTSTTSLKEILVYPAIACTAELA